MMLAIIKQPPNKNLHSSAIPTNYTFTRKTIPSTTHAPQMNNMLKLLAKLKSLKQAFKYELKIPGKKNLLNLQYFIMYTGCTKTMQALYIYINQFRLIKSELTMNNVNATILLF